MKNNNRRYEDMEFTFDESLDSMFDRRWSIGRSLIVFAVSFVGIGIVITIINLIF